MIRRRGANEEEERTSTFLLFSPSCLLLLCATLLFVLRRRRPGREERGKDLRACEGLTGGRCGGVGGGVEEEEELVACQVWGVDALREPPDWESPPSLFQSLLCLVFLPVKRRGKDRKETDGPSLSELSVRRSAAVLLCLFAPCGLALLSSGVKRGSSISTCLFLEGATKSDLFSSRLRSFYGPSLNHLPHRPSELADFPSACLVVVWTCLSVPDNLRVRQAQSTLLGDVRSACTPCVFCIPVMETREVRRTSRSLLRGG